MTFDEKDRPLNESRGRDDDQSIYARGDELKQIRIDRVSDQEVFIGRAVAQDTATSDELWQIQRITIIADNTEVKEFAAKGAYNQVWDDRGSIFPAFTPGTGAVGGTTIFEPLAVTFTDASGTATTTSAQELAANLARVYLYIKNLGNKSIWVNFGIVAVDSQPSIELLPNEVYELKDSIITTESVNIRSDAGSQDFVLKEA